MQPFLAKKKIELNTYLIYIFSLVWLDGISTILGYLMPNHVYKYILDIYFLYT